MPHPATLETDELLKQCRFSTMRRGGPGGQHRNKVESAAVVQHVPTEVIAEANERRSQKENHNVALFRLRVNLALTIRTTRAKEDLVANTWTQRTANQKIAVAPEHRDFPALLAEALDWITFYEFDLKQAAEKLSVSTSQLVKFLKLDNRGMSLVNSERSKRDMHRLK